MEDDNEWETIQPSTSASLSDKDDDADTLVVTTLPNFNHPLTNHEDFLPVSPQPPQDNLIQQPPSPPSSSTTTDVVENELSATTTPLIKASLAVLSSWVLRIGYDVRRRIGLWSVVSVGVFFTVMTYARRWQRRRRLVEKDQTNKLLLLLNQKDEKIKQLLLQIDRMNETLSARRRVPVIRVVVDSPVVIGPRLN